MDLTAGQATSLILCRLVAVGKVWLVRHQVWRQLCPSLPEDAFKEKYINKNTQPHYCQGRLSRQLVKLGALKPRTGRAVLITHAQARQACKVRLRVSLVYLCFTEAVSKWLAGYAVVACCSCCAGAALHAMQTLIST